MKIAGAQGVSQRGDIDVTISTYLNAVEKAGAEGSEYIVFPELSFTGYEAELAADMA